MTILRVLLGLLLTLTLSAAGAQQLAAVPPLQSQVTDTIGMLTPAQRSALENVLRDYKTKTGSEIAILLVGSTAPEVIEQYSIRVADAWKVGRKGIDDGAILIVARDNPKDLRRLRIEAGRGVQGTLTDLKSKRILDEIIAPHFKQNDYYGGLAAAVSAMTTLLDAEHLPAPAKPAAQSTDDGGGIGWMPLLFIAILFMMMSRGGRSRRSLSSNGWGNAAGVILGSMIGNRMGGGGGLGGGGGFGGGGGGFSGGGGSFDGGGASGDW